MTEAKLSTSDIASKERTARDDGREAETTRPDMADEPLRREAQAEESLEPRVHEPEREPLLPTDQSGRFTGRWQEIQASFVDQPRRSVEEADRLVADLMQQLAASFADERNRLEEQWDRGDDVSTEDLRLALTHYRSFFDRLLSA